jgi:hypothetical protein
MDDEDQDFISRLARQKEDERQLERKRIEERRKLVLTQHTFYFLIFL